MGKKGPMPPNGGGRNPFFPGLPVSVDSVKLYDTYCLEFLEPGIFFYQPLGHFTPEIPMGIFPVGCLPVAFTAVTEGVITIFFTSLKDPSQTYVEILTISAEADPGTDICPCTDLGT